MKSLLPLALVLTIALAAPAAGGDVKLQVANGRITLQARDASLREILAEWARVGQVRFVNADKVMGDRMTLDLRDVPEAQALNVLLRNVSGYVAAPRVQPASTPASAYASVFIMSAPRAAASLAPASAGMSPQPTMPVRPMLPPGMMMDDDQNPPGYPGGAGYPRGMINATPQQQGGAYAPPVPGQVPNGAPGTVSPMPQMVQPGAPGTPGSVSRPPGGPGGGPGGGADPDGPGGRPER